LQELVAIWAGDRQIFKLKNQKWEPRMGFGSQKDRGVRKTGDPEVGGGARSGAEEPGLIEEPEVNREVDTATDQ